MVNDHWWECDGARGGTCHTPDVCADIAHDHATARCTVCHQEPGDDCDHFIAR